MNWWIICGAILLSLLGVGRNRYVIWARERDRELTPTRVLIAIDDSTDVAGLKEFLARECPGSSWQDHIEPSESGPKRFLLVTMYVRDLRLLPAGTVTRPTNMR